MSSEKKPTMNKNMRFKAAPTFFATALPPKPPGEDFFLVAVVIDSDDASSMSSAIQDPITMACSWIGPIQRLALDLSAPTAKPKSWGTNIRTLVSVSLPAKK
jgi:hypothetical protein